MSQRLPLVLSLVLVAALGAGTALAEEAKDPDVAARLALMHDLKAQMKLLGEAATGKAPFDADRVAAAIAALQAGTGQIAPRFRPHADDPVSEALPDIWNEPSEFRQKVRRMSRAAEALDGRDAGALSGTLAPVQAACKDCHGRFKI